jgi:hypothetical protein
MSSATAYADRDSFERFTNGGRMRAPLFALAFLWMVPAASAAQAPAPDPAIAAIVAKVSAERLKAADTKLVGFGTRNTFSEKLGDQRGVFAARAWIADQFREIAKASQGRMTVAYDTHVHAADGKRVPRDVEISSVIATLKGDEPGGRTYVMSSHYDSRNSDNADITQDAPGADDNGSGTAAVIEAARVMAALPTHATVIFATYDSEEQGLLGSAHHAAALKAAGVDVEGDLNNDIIGASVGDQGEKNPGLVRIFSEALAAGADPKQVNLVGNENDSPSRELARYAQEVGDRYQPEFKGELVFRLDRFLRGGDHSSFNAQGFPAIRFVEPVETFRAPAPERAHREGRALRRPPGVHGLRLPGARHALQRFRARLAGDGPGLPGLGEGADEGARQQDAAHVDAGDRRRVL